MVGAPPAAAGGPVVVWEGLRAVSPIHVSALIQQLLINMVEESYRRTFKWCVQGVSENKRTRL